MKERFSVIRRSGWHLKSALFCIILLISGFPLVCHSQFLLKEEFRKDKWESSKIAGKESSRLLYTPGNGGPGIKVTRFDGQPALMTGGRGGVIFNNRILIGGGGYGILTKVNLPDVENGPREVFKMGYGGPELGFILLPGDRVRMGTALMLAGGAAFRESNREEQVKGFRIFPVMEPSVFARISICRSLQFQLDFSYRYIYGSGFEFLTDKKMSGLAFSFTMLFGS